MLVPTSSVSLSSSVVEWLTFSARSATSRRWFPNKVRLYPGTVVIRLDCSFLLICLVRLDPSRLVLRCSFPHLILCPHPPRFLSLRPFQLNRYCDCLRALLVVLPDSVRYHKRKPKLVVQFETIADEEHDTSKLFHAEITVPLAASKDLFPSSVHSLAIDRYREGGLQPWQIALLEEL